VNKRTFLTDTEHGLNLQFNGEGLIVRANQLHVKAHQRIPFVEVFHA
jgi:hypothetical protein